MTYNQCINYSKYNAIKTSNKYIKFLDDNINYLVLTFEELLMLTKDTNIILNCEIKYKSLTHKNIIDIYNLIIK